MCSWVRLEKGSFGVGMMYAFSVDGMGHTEEDADGSVYFVSVRVLL